MWRQRWVTLVLSSHRERKGRPTTPLPKTPLLNFFCRMIEVTIDIVLTKADSFAQTRTEKKNYFVLVVFFLSIYLHPKRTVKSLKISYSI